MIDVEPAFAFELRVFKVRLEVVKVEEDSMALASAIETLAFPLAKTVSQTLIASFTCVHASYS